MLRPRISRNHLDTLCGLLLTLSLGCAPTRFVEPIPQGHYAATAALGGPLVTFSGLVIPLPLTSLAAGYGVTASGTAFAGLHTTAMAYEDIQFDAGYLQKLVSQSGAVPAISVAPVANLVLGLRDGAFKLWPEFDLNAYWKYGVAENMIYLSNSNWFELASRRGNGEPQETHWLPNLAIGHVFDGGSDSRWQYTTELRYLAVCKANQPNVVEYHGISGHGDLGIYLALTRKF